ncbi:MAG TPA: hypothetical protein PKA00_23675 [Saprospiraceae bacterium]|nr:hypothetical protein [Saprospiraceae bacterium]HMQ85930.1 hypothetical protein [Saprospiraceae bacterium]
MLRFYIPFLVLAIALGACTNTDSSAQKAAESNKGTESAQNAPTAAEATQYPSLPFDTLKAIWEQCDYIDYVFFYESFSVNQSQKPDIQAALQHISSEVPVIDPSCNRPVARIFYQVKGENRLEADLYFDSKCVFFLFYNKGQKAYANKMTPSGLKFFQNIYGASQQMKQSGN